MTFMYSLIRLQSLEKNPKLINVGPTFIPDARVSRTRLCTQSSRVRVKVSEYGLKVSEYGSYKKSPTFQKKYLYENFSLFLVSNSLVCYFAMQDGSQDFDLGPKRLILARDNRLRSCPNIGDSYGTPWARLTNDVLLINKKIPRCLPANLKKCLYFINVLGAFHLGLNPIMSTVCSFCFTQQNIYINMCM